jgi:hypothetical protein
MAMIGVIHAAFEIPKSLKNRLSAEAPRIGTMHSA